MRTEGLKVYFKREEGLFRSSYVHAVDGVTLSLKRGELLEVIGESGSGKTTLGRALVGLQKPTAGRVYYMGKDVLRLKGEEWEDYRRSVQLIHQDPYSSLNPYRTIYDSMASPLLRWKICPRSQVVSKVYELLEFVGLSPPELYASKYPHQLSGGQRQRIAIASVLGVNPRVIVADEIVSMIDVSLRVGLLDLLAEVRKRSETSYVFITHDLAVGRYFSHKLGGGRVAVMYRGKVVESGKIEEIVNKPLHPYTQLLVESAKEDQPEGEPKAVNRQVVQGKGCTYASRCPFAMPVCFDVEPPIKTVDGREVACHLY